MSRLKALFVCLGFVAGLNCFWYFFDQSATFQNILLLASIGIGYSCAGLFRAEAQEFSPTIAMIIYVPLSVLVHWITFRPISQIWPVLRPYTLIVLDALQTLIERYV